jgi:predicted flap endonuclease-1-like 5' DNA nuclease
MNSHEATIKAGSQHIRTDEEPTVLGSMGDLLRISLRLGEQSLDFAEQQVSAVLNVVEQFRDDLIPPELKTHTRQEGLTARFRADTHRAVDIAFDLSIGVINTTSNSLDELANIVDSRVGSKIGQKRSHSGDLERVEGIGPVIAQQFYDAGIYTCDELLAVGAGRQGRQELAEKIGLSSSRLLRWINMIDLFRINGVDSEYADLLEAAGVDSVPELAQRNPENLHKTLVETNEGQNRVRRLPGISEVTDWVTQAKALPRILTY